MLYICITTLATLLQERARKDTEDRIEASFTNNHILAYNIQISKDTRRQRSNNTLLMKIELHVAEGVTRMTTLTNRIKHAIIFS